MSDSSITRVFATDPRISNPKPIEMHTNATLFLQDGEALGSRATAGQFFLFVHGIELALKAHLHEKGFSLDDLRHVGHNLMELLRACEDQGLALSEPDTSAIVARLDTSLEKAKIRYDFEFHLPLLEDVRRVARGILRDAQPPLPPFE